MCMHVELAWATKKADDAETKNHLGRGYVLFCIRYYTLIDLFPTRVRRAKSALFIAIIGRSSLGGSRLICGHSNAMAPFF
jgi:hypothetical protein